MQIIYSRVVVKAINSFDKSDHEVTYTSKGDDSMPAVSKQIIDMIDMLPESEQELAFEMIKRMVLAWDSDFTKLTPLERERLIQSEKEIANGETVNHLDIDWN